MKVIARLTIPEGRASGEYTLTLLKDLQTNDFTPQKIQELWLASRKHSVLFSDYTEGKLQPFLEYLYAPNVVIFEIYRNDEQKPVSMLYVDQIAPHFDAKGHFAFWDSIGSGREALVQAAMSYVFHRFGLQRMTCEIPVYQRGALKFAERLGFTLEGERREGVLYKGSWANEKVYGILREEFFNDERIQQNNVRWGDIWNSDRNPWSSDGSFEDISAGEPIKPRDGRAIQESRV